jgi:putative nucleotidyltransferase with HDIG domain
MSSHIANLSTPARAYLAAVIGLGAIAIGRSAIDLVQHPVGADWLVLAALTLLTGSFSIKVPSVDARISVSEAFVIAGVLLFGPPVATLIVALDSLVLTTWIRSPGRSSLRALFNMTAGALAISCATRLFEWWLPVYPAASADLDILLLPVFGLALSYFAINSWLIAVALAFERREPPQTIWRRNFLWLGLNYLGGASVALVLASYSRNINLTAVSIVVPLLVVIYLTFRTSWGRLEDANKHVRQLNELYLSTIETLAMAVDAKDQITHGHIRRVQVFATELARRLGVSDDGQQKAIAAAALLHDMGKLAIPEHILNKPGRLTTAEFERMKQHADLGADLLSSIRFPYPVVPIVRYHHENWDGTGYPSGISGTDIPLGARILSVVDCFDALTSDRPYRPRLTTDEAFEIIQERRGTMYDPLVVDTFIRSYPEISPLAMQAGQEARTIFASEAVIGTTDAAVSRPLRKIRENASEAALLQICSQQIAKAPNVKDAFEIVAQCLRQLMPATVYSLYEFESQGDRLICRYIAGDAHRLIHGLTIPLGQRVTGWAGANRRTAINADASLDLAQIAKAFDPHLLSAISTPLNDQDTLIGVLTAYSLQAEAFNESHRYTFEYVCGTLSARLCTLRLTGAPHLLSFPWQKN